MSRSRRSPDLADVRGLTLARRALEIAAVGNHGLLLEGPPGSGKSMLARCLPGLLAELDPEDALVVTRIRSSAGMLGEQVSLFQVPPLRAPHHTSSTAALIGGGNPIRPGEVTLAHRGVLLLDEAPEFRRDALEALRQPLQDGEVTIARRGQVLQMPADFQLVATRNPCPCGLHGSPGQHCLCTPALRSRYLGRLSGPLLDRLAISVWVDPTPLEDVLSECSSEPSSQVAERVSQARSLLRSQKPADAHSHPPAAGASELMQWVGLLTKAGRREFERQVSSIRLSTRRLGHLLQVSQSIAALDEKLKIERHHVIEAAFFACRPVGEGSSSIQTPFTKRRR
ncbi:MAG: ATP-binding protein [Myxococcota bacterium]|nr:ATP-binding protein [Myxococcota bacterium]